MPIVIAPIDTELTIVKVLADEKSINQNKQAKNLLFNCSKKCFKILVSKKHIQ